MSNVIHGKSTAALRYLRREPAALAVYWCYVARTNKDGVAWPSGDGLARDTGWDKATCLKGRALLVELKALELVEKYVRPQWRELKGKPLAQKLNLDRSEYYRLTGILSMKGVIYNLLYISGNDENDIDNFTDGLPRPPTTASDVRRDRPELAISTTELESKTPVPSADATESDYANFLENLHAPKQMVKRPAGAMPNPNHGDLLTANQPAELIAPPEFDMLVTAVTATLKQYGGGAEVFAKMLMGFKGRGEFNTYRMDIPVTATELQDWALWYKRENPGLNAPTAPMKLTSSILAYRDQLENRTAVRNSAPPAAAHTDLHAEIELRSHGNAKNAGKGGKSWEGL